MNRKQIVALKLQMGISPSAQIAPDVLRTMWQSLELENAPTQRQQSSVLSQANTRVSYRLSS